MSTFTAGLLACPCGDAPSRKLPRQFPIPGKWRSAQNSLSLLQGEGRFAPFQWLGDRKGPPCIAAKKRTHSYGYSRSLALRSLLAPRSRPEKGLWRRTVVARAKLRKKHKARKSLCAVFQKRDIRTDIAAQIFQTTLRIIGTSMNAGQKDFRIFARVPAHVAEYCKK